MTTTRTTKTVYHGTTRECADAILADGFSLDRIKPRWMNDLAISTCTTEGAVRRLFGKREVVVLRLKVQGRFLRLARFETGPVEGATSARDYTLNMAVAGVDAVHREGGTVYIYNPTAIQSVEEVA